MDGAPRFWDEGLSEGLMVYPFVFGAPRVGFKVQTGVRHLIRRL